MATAKKYFSILICLFLVPFSVAQVLAQTFTEVSLASGISHKVVTRTMMGGGCAFFDYNNDGLLDAYINGGERRDHLYKNLGSGQFVEVGVSAGLSLTDFVYTMGVTTGDYDNDGDRDIFVATSGMPQFGFEHVIPNILYRNNGNGTFTNVAAAAGITDSAWSVSASFGDYNNDGWLDIYVANYIDSIGFLLDANNDLIGFNHKGIPNYLYINNGNGTFTESAQQLGVDDAGCSLAVTFSDYDMDADQDIHVVNDFGQWVIPDALYKNEFPSDSFTDVRATSNADIGVYGMGIGSGDYDEDGDFDYYVTNLGRNVLLNNQNGVFQDVTASAGVENTTVDTLLSTGWGTAFLDYDNDTYLDLYVSNGQIPSAEIIANHPDDPNKLYRNNSDGTFTDVSVITGLSDSSNCRGFAKGDYDNDGDLDLLAVVVTDNAADPVNVLLYRNDLNNGNNWLKIKTEGVYSNRDGYGTLVEVFVQGRRFIQEISGGSSHASQNSSIAHFGLGSYPVVDSVRISWPSGILQTVNTIASNQMITLREDDALLITTSVPVQICRGDSVFAGGAYQTITGNYYDTITVLNGFDSVIITELSVVQAVYKNITVEFCEGESVFAGGAFQTLPGIYQDTFSSMMGCDSIVTTNLVQLPDYHVSATIEICEGDSVLIGSTWRTVTGNYMDAFIATTGCDSLVDVNLLVHPNYHFVVNDSICAGDSVMLAGGWQSTSGSYFDTLVTVHGCDSVRETILFIFPTNQSTRVNTICEGDSIYLEGNWQNTTGTYWDTLASSVGCDSIIKNILVVWDTYFNTVDELICEGDSIFMQGAWQHSAGTYFDTLSTIHGCDSVVQVNLSIQSISISGDSLMVCPGNVAQLTAPAGFEHYYWLPEGDTSPVVFGGKGFYEVTVMDNLGCQASATFTVDTFPGIQIALPDTISINQGEGVVLEPVISPAQVNTVYQWSPSVRLSCDDCMTPTAQPIVETCYELIVIDQFACVDSATVCINFADSITTVNDIDHLGITFYPNPVDDYFKIDFGQLIYSATEVRLFNANGKEVISKELNLRHQMIVDVTSLPPGLYFLSVNTGSIVFYEKVVVK